MKLLNVKNTKTIVAIMMLSAGLSVSADELMMENIPNTKKVGTELAIEYGESGTIGGSVIIGKKINKNLFLFGHARSNKYSTPINNKHSDNIYLKEIDINIAYKINENFMIYSGSGALATNYNYNVELKEIKPILTGGVVLQNWGYSVNIDTFINNRDNCSVRVSVPLYMHTFKKAIVNFAVYDELNRFDSYSFNSIGARIGVGF